MKIDVTKSMFRDAFTKFESTNRYDQLGGYDGLGALYDYLVQMEEDLELDLELDPVGLCCEYAYYESIEDFNDDYGVSATTFDDIREYTEVIEINENEFIIRQY
jgi:hypothetical protein